MGDVRQRPACDDEVGDLRLKAAAAATKIYIECSFHIQIVRRLPRLSFGVRPPCLLFILQ
jgi:hypothetical protein